METANEATLPVEDYENDSEDRPLSTEEKVLIAKAIGTAVFLVAAASYGTAVATYQVSRATLRKIQKHYTKKKELKTNH